LVLLLAAFLLGPSIAVILALVVVATIFDRYPQIKARRKDKNRATFLCPVCGAENPLGTVDLT
jgi:hypothetical protein